MDVGFYRGIEPAEVVPASNAEALRKALQATIARGNPDVAMLQRSEWKPPVVLKYAGVKTWSAFERGMRTWSIENKDGNYQIAEQKKQPDGMWKDDPDRRITFPPGAPIDDVVQRMISILQNAAASSR